MKLRALWVSVFVILSAMVIVIDLAPQADGATLYVGSGGGNYSTIQSAILAANPGDTVFVYAGTYNEVVTVTKTLTLIGEDRDNVIINGVSGNTVTITADWVNMTGFTVRQSGGGWNDGGLVLSNVQYCYVAGNRIADNGRDGIRVIDTQDSTVENNYIYDNVDEGIHIQNSFGNNILNNTAFSHHSPGFGGTADGILVYQSGDNLVEGNNVYDNDNGVNVVDGADNNIITNNIATLNTQYGIVIDSSMGNTLTFNSLTENGIFIMGGLIEHWNTHNIDSSNTVNGKQAYYWKNQTGGAIPAGAGEVILANCTNVNVNGQFIANSSVGIEMGFSSNNNVLNNDVRNQTRGIYLYSSDGNAINANTANGNDMGIEIESSDNIILDGNTAYMNEIGFNIGSSDNNSIINNNLMNNTNSGTYIRYGTNNTLSNNNVMGNGYGIYYRDSTAGDIMNNNITRNDWGIWIRQSSSNNVTNNNVSFNNIGIRNRASESNNISFNTLFYNVDHGIYVTSTSYYNWIGNNTISESETGIMFAPWNNWRPTNNNIMGNSIANSQAGIYLNQVLSNTLSENTMVLCGIFIYGGQLNQWNEHFIDTSNTVNGKPVYYWKNQTGGGVPPDGGQVILANCTNVMIATSTLTFGTVGIELGYSTVNNIFANNASSNNWYGIYLYSSDDNTISSNTQISYNGRSGINIFGSQRVNVDSNTMEMNGIWIEGNQIAYWNTHTIDTTNTVNSKPLYYWKDQMGGSVPSDGGQVILANCSDVEIRNSELVLGTVGILMGYSINITTNSNNLSGNRMGIRLYNSDQSTILNNTVSYNTEYGIQLELSGSNLIYHNNIIENGAQAFDNGMSNNWNEPYSVSGNYWSDYTGPDLFYGPLQDMLGSDGVGDTPYIIDFNSADDYPLMNHWDYTSSIPTAPQNLVVAPGNIFVNLTWGPPFDSGGLPVYTYRIYRNTSSGNEVFYVDSGSGLFFNDTNVTAGITYYYEISAVTILGEGPISNEDFGMPFSEPSAPLNLILGSGDSFVNLSWSPPLENGGFPVTNYTIYRGLTSGALTFFDEIGNLTTYNDTAVTNGIEYFYAVKAKNPVGEGPQSNLVSATPVTIPGPPIVLTPQFGDSFINITWNPPVSDGGSPITNYAIYRGTTSGTYTLIKTIGNVTYYYDTPLTNGEQYFYVIFAMNSQGEGPASLEVNATPARPPFNVMNLNADGSDTIVNLSWEPPSNNGGAPVTGYLIYKGTEPGNLTFLIELGDVLYYEDTGLTNGNTYYYQVSAKNMIGEGPLSSEIQGIPATIPGAPTGLTGISGDSFVGLSWTAPASDGGSAITNYRIYRGTSPGSLTLYDEVGNILTYNDTSVTNGGTYFYKVVAVNAKGEGPLSNEETNTPQGPPSVPLAPQIEEGKSYVYLSWTAPDSDGGSAITRYLIYRGTTSGSETLYDETTGDLFFNDTGVTNGVEYFYKISAENAVGESPLSSGVSAIPFSYPGAPLNLTSATGNSYVHLTWTAPESAGSSAITNYVIYRGNGSGQETELTEIGAVLFYNDTSVTNGETYYYFIIAKNSEGTGARSEEVTGTPISVPGIITVISGITGGSFVKLTWEPPSSDGGSEITGYRIYRGTEAGGQTLLVEIGNLLTYNDTTVTDGVTYYYKVSSINAVGEGALSGELSFLPQTDTDGDGQADHIDTDDDNDGLSDSEEADLGTDPLLADTDGDGRDDGVDEFPLDPGKWKKEEPESSNLMPILIIIIVVVVVLVLFLVTRKKGEPKEEPLLEEEKKDLPPPPGKAEEVPEGETGEPEMEEEPEGEESGPEEMAVEDDTEVPKEELQDEEHKVDEPVEPGSEESEPTSEGSEIDEQKEDILKDLGLN